jgi:exopolyphosphatase/pppGpp-phosphohydrolase
MNSIEQLQQEAENLKSIDTANLTPEQLTQLVEKLSKMMDASESALLGIKTQLDQVKTEIENDTDNQ